MRGWLEGWLYWKCILLLLVSSSASYTTPSGQSWPQVALSELTSRRMWPIAGHINHTQLLGHGGPGSSDGCGGSWQAERWICLLDRVVLKKALDNCPHLQLVRPLHYPCQLCDFLLVCQQWHKVCLQSRVCYLLFHNNLGILYSWVSTLPRG